MFWGLAIGGMSIGAIASSYLARGTSQTPGVCVVGATGAAAHCFFCCFLCLCEAVRGFPCFLEFLAPSFSDLFPWTS